MIKKERHINWNKQKLPISLKIVMISDNTNNTKSSFKLSNKNYAGFREQYWREESYTLNSKITPFTQITSAFLSSWK